MVFTYVTNVESLMFKYLG